MTDLLVNLGQHPAMVRLGWTLLHFVWQAPLVAAGLAAALWFLREAGTRYLAGCVALVLLALLPLATWTTLPGVAPADMSLHVPARGAGPSAGRISKPATTEGAEQILVSAPSLSYKMVTARRHVTRYLELSLPFLIACWMAGVLVMAVRLLLGSLCVERIRDLAQEAEPQWQARLAAMAQRLKISRTVRLLQSSLVEGATQIGWLRPVVLLPASLLTNLTAQELDALLAHELAHVRRHDYLVNVLQSVVEACLFYHPAVWWVSAVIRKERENCCDDIAVDISGGADHYVTALTVALQLRVAATPLALSAAGGAVRRRIQRIHRRAKSPAPARSAMASRTGLTAVALLLVSLTALAWQSSRLATRSSESSYRLGEMPNTRDPDAKLAVASGSDHRASLPISPMPARFDVLGHSPDHPLDLNENGEAAFWNRMSRGEELHRYWFRVHKPGPVAIQVVSLTDGFKPFVVTTWPTADGRGESDGDIMGGRGGRAFKMVNLTFPSPPYCIGVDIYPRMTGSPEAELTGEYGDYAVLIRQPGSAGDKDADTVGLESSPIVLDESGYGDVEMGRKFTTPTAIDILGDVDTFQFPVRSRAAITVSVKGQGGLQPMVTFCEASGRVIRAVAGDATGCVEYTYEPKQSDELVYIVVAAGDGRSTGRYELQARQKPVWPRTVELGAPVYGHGDAEREIGTSGRSRPCGNWWIKGQGLAADPLEDRVQRKEVRHSMGGAESCAVFG